MHPAFWGIEINSDCYKLENKEQCKKILQRYETEPCSYIFYLNSIKDKLEPNLFCYLANINRLNHCHTKLDSTFCAFEYIKILYSDHNKAYEYLINIKSVCDIAVIYYITVKHRYYIKKHHEYLLNKLPVKLEISVPEYNEYQDLIKQNNIKSALEYAELHDLCYFDISKYYMKQQKYETAKYFYSKCECEWHNDRASSKIFKCMLLIFLNAEPYDKKKIAKKTSEFITKYPQQFQEFIYNYPAYKLYFYKYDVKIAYKAGFQYFKVDNMLALKYFKQALKMKHPKAGFQIGILYLHIGDYLKSYKYIKNNSDTDPEKAKKCMDIINNKFN